MALNSRITTYAMAFDSIDVPLNDKMRCLLKDLEQQGHKEKSICYAIWKAQDKLIAFRRDPRFQSILLNEIRKYSWSSDDPRWQVYNQRKQAEADVIAGRNKIRELSKRCK